MDSNKQWPLLLIFCLIILLLPVLLFPKVDKSIESESNNLNIIQGSYLLSTSPPLIESPNLLEEIIKRESGGDPKICNKNLGCLGGMGLTQIISGTWNTSLDRMQEDEKYLPSYCIEYINLPVTEDRSEAIFDPDCHRVVAEWLLRTDGIRHWEEWSGPYDLSIYTL